MPNNSNKSTNPDETNPPSVGLVEYKKTKESKGKMPVVLSKKTPSLRRLINQRQWAERMKDINAKVFFFLSPHRWGYNDLRGARWVVESTQPAASFSMRTKDAT